MVIQPEPTLSMRERQIMDVVYARGHVTPREVAEAIPNPPTINAVRTMLGILEEKGHVKRSRRGRGTVYKPVVPVKRAGRSALRRVLNVFFNGSVGSALAAHLADPRARLSEAELDRLEELIAEARSRRGRR